MSVSGRSLTDSRSAFGWSVLFLLLLIVFSIAVNDGAFRSFDSSIAHGLRATLPAVFPWVFGVICRTGNAEWTVPAGLFLVVFLLRRRTISRRQALFWTVWFVSGMLLEHVLKIRLLQPHPGPDVANDPLDHYLKPILADKTPGSYFSGHTFRAFWLALLLFNSCRWCRTGSLIWASLIWIGVIVLGWHWTTDTLGALLFVGTGGALFLGGGRSETSGPAEKPSSIRR